MHDAADGQAELTAAVATSNQRVQRTARGRIIPSVPAAADAHNVRCDQSSSVGLPPQRTIRVVSSPQSREVIAVSVDFNVETELETDGRWLAEVVELPGVLAYGLTQDEAIAHVQALALRVVADRLEHDEAGSDYLNISFSAA
jgi:predicted RNase H-like HicB family nuclease